jgi:hypothetical protein
MLKGKQLRLTIYQLSLSTVSHAGETYDKHAGVSFYDDA